MSVFMDGPAAGESLSIKRAPYLLRVVVDRQTGGIDALDQHEDEPGEGEDVYVYRLAAPPQTAHLCFRGSKKGSSGRWEFGIYAYLPDVDGNELRDTAAWRAWAIAKHTADVEVAPE